MFIDINLLNKVAREMNITEIIKLSDLLAEMGIIKRATMLPNHDNEPDSHHSFSLALIAYHIVVSECPELDANLVILFALCHDLLEIITGDEVTLHYTAEQHKCKQAKEKEALKQFDKLFASYPEIKDALYKYEKLDTSEASTVFVLDKASTTWTHHQHRAKYARKMNIHTKHDVAQWAHRQREKMKSRLKVQPPQQILDIYEDSFKTLQKLYDE